MFLTHFEHGTALLNDARRQVVTPAEKSVNGDFHLNHPDGRRAEFRIRGDVAVISWWQADRFLQSRITTNRTDAREYYGKLVRAGYMVW